MGQSLFFCFSYFDPMFCCIYTSAVDRSDQSKNHKVRIECFSTKHATLSRREGEQRLAVSKSRYSTIQNVTKCVGLV